MTIYTLNIKLDAIDRKTAAVYFKYVLSQLKLETVISED